MALSLGTMCFCQDVRARLVKWQWAAGLVAIRLAVSWHHEAGRFPTSRCRHDARQAQFLEGRCLRYRVFEQHKCYFVDVAESVVLDVPLAVSHARIYLCFEDWFLCGNWTLHIFAHPTSVEACCRTDTSGSVFNLFEAGAVMAPSNGDFSANV